MIGQPPHRHTANHAVSRRALLATGAFALGAGVSPRTPAGQGTAAGQGFTPERAVVRGRLRQSVCRWCYQRIPLADLAAAAKTIGLQSVELLQPSELETVIAAGLTCAVVSSHPLTRGLCNPEYHEECTTRIRASIDAAAAHGCPNVICFSGNRGAISVEAGLEHCVRGLQQVVGYAESKNVTLLMELLNSKVDHPDYLADHTAFGVALVDRVGSERFKLLYDIYHMQIMEGDVIRTIERHHDKIGHYHTAGNPGRHEIDETQELNYPAIARAIVDTGYIGFLAQDVIPPDPEPLRALARGVAICDV